MDFIERELALPPRARILDVPCGSGRHALTLAARGHRVTGVDISTEALGYARRAAAAAGVDVEFVESDMRQVRRGGAFDAAVCLGNSFGYLDRFGGPDGAPYELAAERLLLTATRAVRS